jgi:hypothetical protein
MLILNGQLVIKKPPLILEEACLLGSAEAFSQGKPDAALPKTLNVNINYEHIGQSQTFSCESPAG